MPPSDVVTKTLNFAARTATLAARAVNPEQSNNLGGKKAKTPIIAGSICGGIVLLAWLIGFAVYFRKRYNRKKRNQLIAQGKAQPREKDIEMVKEKVIIPPDPAVLLGQRQPGEVAFPEDEEPREGHHHKPWSRHGSHTKGGHEITGSPSQSDKDSSSPKTGNDTTFDTKDDNSVVDEMRVPPNIKT
ncbi:hypothetical protein CPC08DRAFT_757856 [Agrocybe pediades]|nr:hypothetical protein CPC08DRAFT_757856 [Agrocybe pediades]